MKHKIILLMVTVALSSCATKNNAPQVGGASLIGKTQEQVTRAYGEPHSVKKKGSVTTYEYKDLERSPLRHVPIVSAFIGWDNYTGHDLSIDFEGGKVVSYDKD